MQEKKDAFDALQAVFHATSIAVVGASSDPAKGGYRMVKDIVDFGFPGRLYPINPGADQVYGVKAYPSLEQVPGPVEYAIIMVAAEKVSQAVRDCACKGVKVAHIFSAGFAEAGEEGRRLQDELVAIARAGGLRLIGPNCMGVYSSAARVNCFSNPPDRPGGVGVISQSGMYTYDFLRQGGLLGVRFSKAVSYGNACDLDVTDFLAYLGADPDTRVICLYLEGVRDGRRFFEVARRITKEKPILLLKGGWSEQGRHAALSHTASLAGDQRVWMAAMRQAGIICVDSFQALVEAALVFDYLRPPAGRGVALVGQGGGASVVATDLCASFGLVVPAFHPTTVERLRRLELPPGTSLNNPIDPTSRTIAMEGGTGITGILDAVRDDPDIDALVVHLNLSTFMAQLRPEEARGIVANTVDCVIETAKSSVPLILVLRGCGELSIEAIIQEEQRKCLAYGVPLLSSLESALRALASLVHHQELLAKAREMDPVL